MIKLKNCNKLLIQYLVHISPALLPYVIITSLSNNGCLEGLQWTWRALIERSEVKLGFHMKLLAVPYSTEASSFCVRPLLLKFILPLYSVSNSILLFLQVQPAKGYLICLQLTCLSFKERKIVFSWICYWVWLPSAQNCMVLFYTCSYCLCLG